MGVARFDGTKWGYSGLLNPVQDDWGRHYFRSYADGVLVDTNMRSSIGFRKPIKIASPEVEGFHYFREYTDGVLDETDLDQGVEFTGGVVIDSNGYLFGYHYFSSYTDGVLTDTNMTNGVEFDDPLTIE